jgi:hypothetical protein
MCWDVVSITIAGGVREGDVNIHINVFTLIGVHGNERVFRYLWNKEVIDLVTEEQHDSLIRDDKGKYLLRGRGWR